VKLGVLGKEFSNPPGFVAGKVVQDDVDFPALGLKLDQLAA
jgi:hypothetical protein